MAHAPDPPLRIGTQGWKQFLTSKKEMLDAFDRAKEQAKVHEVETYHGKVAEAEFRQWLCNFLPKKYAVTAGYVISQGAQGDTKAPHFDVIIYDELASPVLWYESHSDLSNAGRTRAIPAEYVHAVIEVKSSFKASYTRDAIKHLFDLEPLLINIDAPNELYKKYLPPNFFSAVVFFELCKTNEYSKAALNNLVPAKELRGYSGGLILRGEGLLPDVTGRIDFLSSAETALESTVGKKKESLLTGSPIADSRVFTDNQHYSVMLHWNQAVFAQFAFDIIALLNGTYQSGFLSSLHGFNWLNPNRLRP